MKKISVPSVASSRVLADRLVDTAQLVDNEPVLIDSRDLDINTESFVSQLVMRVAEAHPSEVQVLGGGNEWIADVQREAQRFRLKVTSRGMATA